EMSRRHGILCWPPCGTGRTCCACGRARAMGAHVVGYGSTTVSMCASPTGRGGCPGGRCPARGGRKPLPPLRRAAVALAPRVVPVPRLRDAQRSVGVSITRRSCLLPRAVLDDVHRRERGGAVWDHLVEQRQEAANGLACVDDLHDHR